MKKKLILIFLLLLLSFVIEGLIIQVFSADEGEKPPLMPEGKVEVTLTATSIRVCPPGIWGLEPCQFPDIVAIIKKIISLILDKSPYILTILIILGGFMYLLSPIKLEQIQKGHRYIKYAIFGYILLLLISSVFTFISLIFGGP